MGSRMTPNKRLENQTLKWQALVFPWDSFPLKVSSREYKRAGSDYLEQLYQLGTAEGSPIQGDPLHILNITDMQL